MEIELSRGLKLGPFASTRSQIGLGTTLTLHLDFWMAHSPSPASNLIIEHACPRGPRNEMWWPLSLMLWPQHQRAGCLDSLLQELVVLAPDTLIRQPHLSAFWSIVLSLRMSHRLRVEWPDPLVSGAEVPVG